MKRAEQERAKVLDMIGATAELVHLIGCRECGDQLRENAQQIAAAFTAACGKVSPE